MKTTISFLFVFLFSFTVTFANSAAIESSAAAAETSEQQNAACTYSLSPTSASFGYNGGTGSFLVTTEPGCLVNATTSQSFITIESATGIGSTRIYYTVGSAQTDRTGVIIVNGQEFTVFQTASCNLTTSYNQSSFPAGGGTGQLLITIGAGCQYTAFTFNPFITFTNGTENGMGSGIVTFSVAPNSGYVRQGTIAVNNVSRSFTQAGECVVSLTPNTATFSRDGGTGSVAITVGANCPYTPTTNSDFITINSGAGTGSGVVNFTVAPNTGLGRTGSIFFPGQVSIVITQFAGTVSARPAFDFDDDYRSDISLFRPANGFWYVIPSQSGNFYGFPFGQAGDQITPADYDGDRKTDIAVWRAVVPSAGDKSYFYILNSSDNSFRAVAFGTAGDIPVPGDWDGDGKADLAVYRGAAAAGGQSYFYYKPSSQPAIEFETIALGTFGDLPVRINYDGDDKLDPAVWQPSTGRWTVLRSSTNQTLGTNFGLPTDIPVPGDYDGDGRGNIAVFRPSEGTWYITGRNFGSFTAVQFGQAGDEPVPADYDGDGRMDVAVYRAGVWYLNRSQSGFTGFAFGAPNDKPTPNAYVRY